MTNTTTPDDWTGIPEEVEKIIKGRSKKTRKEFARGKSVVRTFTHRPFRFIDFSREIGVDNGQAYRYVRGWVIPEGPARKKIIAWVKKHRKPDFNELRAAVKAGIKSGKIIPPKK